MRNHLSAASCSLWNASRVEIEAPMAITVLGGLATSTVLNLLVLLGFIERTTPAAIASTAL